MILINSRISQSAPQIVQKTDEKITLKAEEIEEKMDSDDSDQFQNSPKVPQKTDEKSALKNEEIEEKMDSVVID